MYTKKKIGPRIEPCGTPDVTGIHDDEEPLIAIRCCLFFTYDLNQFIRLLSKPKVTNFDRSSL